MFNLISHLLCAYNLYGFQLEILVTALTLLAALFFLCEGDVLYYCTLFLSCIYSTSFFQVNHGSILKPKSTENTNGGSLSS